MSESSLQNSSSKTLCPNTTRQVAERRSLAVMLSSCSMSRSPGWNPNGWWWSRETPKHPFSSFRTSFLLDLILLSILVYRSLIPTRVPPTTSFYHIRLPAYWRVRVSLRLNPIPTSSTMSGRRIPYSGGVETVVSAPEEFLRYWTHVTPTPVQLPGLGCCN